MSHPDTPQRGTEPVSPADDARRPPGRHQDLEIDTDSVAGEEDPGASIETLIDPPAPDPAATPAPKRP